MLPFTLNRPPNDAASSIEADFQKVWYFNSSLFESRPRNPVVSFSCGMAHGDVAVDDASIRSPEKYLFRYLVDKTSRQNSSLDQTIQRTFFFSFENTDHWWQDLGFRNLVRPVPVLSQFSGYLFICQHLNGMQCLFQPIYRLD